MSNNNLYGEAINELLKSVEYIVAQSINKTTKIYDGLIVSANANGSYNIRFNNETRAVRQYGEGTPQVGQVVKVYIPQGNANLSYFALAGEGSGETPVLMIPIANATTVGGIKANSKTTTDTQAVNIDSDGFLWTAPSTSTETESRLNQLEEDVDGLESSVGNLGDRIDGLNAVQYTAQTLTNSQKTQARTNIGAGTSNFSGAFGDLSGKPTTLAGYGITDAQPAITSANKLSATLVSGLATVATSGSYNDLTNIPPAVTVDSALSTTSTNPVRNSVVTTALNGKYSSTNPPPYPVTSVNGQTGSVTIDEYELPVASSTVLGGIKIGAGLNITSAGVVSTTGEASEVPWSGITNKPTTIGGYGITDASVNTTSKSVSIGGNSLTGLVSDNNYVHTDNNFTDAEKTKLSGIETGATKTIVDNSLSTTSTNPVQNNLVTSALNQKYSSANPPPYPVVSVNGKTGAVALTATDVSALPNNTIYVSSVDGRSGAVVTNAVTYTAQTLTESQKAQARANIGAGASGFSGSYNDLTDVPVSLIKRAYDDTTEGQPLGINANFLNGYTSSYFTNIQITATQPTNQRSDDLWFQLT